MNKKELEAFANEAAKGIKPQKDLAEFSQISTKVTVEAALNAKLGEHLGIDHAHQKLEAGSLFVGADTPLGPLYLGYGHNDAGEGGSLYLFLGPLFSF